LKILMSVPKVLPDILHAFVPYALVLVGFGVFVVWNGGIVLGKPTVVLSLSAILTHVIHR
jgi:hypothetical protein